MTKRSVTTFVEAERLVSKRDQMKKYFHAVILKNLSPIYTTLRRVSTVLSTRPLPSCPFCPNYVSTHFTDTSSDMPIICSSYLLE